MHLLPSVSIQPNLELKTRPKQLLGSIPLVFALPGEGFEQCPFSTEEEHPSHYLGIKGSNPSMAFEKVNDKDDGHQKSLIKRSDVSKIHFNYKINYN